MFDRMYIDAPQITQSVTRTVHEHRAPTDESIKIYREMVEKARAEVLDAVLNGVPDNLLNHVKLEVTDSALTGRRKYRFAFKLNGQPHSFEFADDDGSWTQTKDEIARAVVKKMLDHVGDHLWKALPIGKLGAQR